jgi:hypothetical protein
MLGEPDELPLDEWEILEGDGGVSALVGYDPGSEGVDAEIARSLSRTGRPVHSIRLEDDLASVRLFEGGSYVRDVDAEPHEFLAERGFDLRPPGRVRARSVLVVEGSDPGETAAALELDPAEALHVEPVTAGTVVYSDMGDMSPLLRLLAGKLPSRTVYLLANLPGDHFLAQAVRGEEDLGVLYDPPADDPRLPPLDAVRGERDPEAIARALGVRPELLGLGRMDR